jgi:uncharacterized protein (TIGR03437 family)
VWQKSTIVARMGTRLADPAGPRLTATTNPGQWTAADFNGTNAPTTPDGASVSINGKPAYVWYLSTGQLNVQAPEDSATGNVAITVTNCKSTSAPLASSQPRTIHLAERSTWSQLSLPAEPMY